MTTDIELSCLHLRQFPYSNPTSKACCRRRCIKRKSNDGSGIPIAFFKLPKSEGSTLNVNCEPSWGSMPGIVHSSIESYVMGKNRSNDSLGNEKVDTSSKSFSQASKSRGLSWNQCLEADPSCIQLNAVPNLSSTDQSLQPASLNVSSKKRIRDDHCSHVATSKDEIITLREALKIEKTTLRKLRKELEEERCASAAAATEAMIMISRLQEEKSAALVESRHCKLTSEEREAFNQEAVQLLKEALLDTENEVLSLREHIEVYRGMLAKVKPKHSNVLLRLEEGEKLLLLERSWSAPFSSGNLNKSVHSKIEIIDVTDKPSLPEISECYHCPSEDASQQGHHVEDSLWENDASHVESVDTNGTQTLEDVSLSILDRVARLEERFARLGHNQVVNSNCCDCASDGMKRSVSEQESTRIFDQNDNACNNWKLRKDPVAEDNHDQKNLKHWNVGRVTSCSVASQQEHDFSMLEKCGSSDELKAVSRDPCCEPRSMDVKDTGIEGIHDVYEVQCDLNSCRMPSNMESCKTLVRRVDNTNDLPQGSEDKIAEHILSSSLKDETSFDFTKVGSDPVSVKAWPMNEGRLVHGKPIKSVTAIDDVENLKFRLQALEGERAFMKVALESLRKENMELKLLQDIAQQLRELKGDVSKTVLTRPGHHKLLSVLSFLKGILSFPGMQRSTTLETKRSMQFSVDNVQSSGQYRFPSTLYISSLLMSSVFPLGELLVALESIECHYT